MMWKFCIPTGATPLEINGLRYEDRCILVIAASATNARELARNSSINRDLANGLYSEEEARIDAAWLDHVEPELIDTGREGVVMNVRV